MSDTTLDERFERSIELSLALGDPGGMLFQVEEEQARRLGLDGAEIYAARQGLSFDCRTSHSVALAAASRAGEEERRRRECAKAERLGIFREVCHAIRDLAARLVGGNRG